MPTVVGGVDAFEQAALGLEGNDAVPLAVEHLQSGEDGGVQLRQPVVPDVQLGHVAQQVGLIRHHAGDPVQPDGGSREQTEAQRQAERAEERRMFLLRPRGQKASLYLLYLREQIPELG